MGASDEGGTMTVTEVDRGATGTIRSTIIGRLTRGGAPAFGHRVVCWHHLEIGVADEREGCVAAPPEVRRVGEAVVNDNGDFAVAFDAVAEPASACSFNSLVRVEAFSGATLLWESVAAVAPLVRFEGELRAS
jgi:hypothetical protein